MRDTYIQKKIQMKITDGIEICESVKLWNNHKRFGHSPSSVWKPLSLRDKELTKLSDVIDYLHPGDDLRADKGFDIQDDFAANF